MNSRILTRIGAGVLAAVAAVALSLAGASVASADTADRTLSLTRVDGSPIGTLFSDWTMVPGDIVSTTVVAHRTGGGVSSLLITLGDDSAGTSRAATAVEDDVVITVASNGVEHSSSAAELMRGDTMFDLGRSSVASVPITVTFELPFSSGNATQLQSIDLSLMVVATDVDAPKPPTDVDDDAAAPAGGDTAFPNLPSTGASVRDVLIAAAVVTCLGLLLLGGRRRRDDGVDAD